MKLPEVVLRVPRRLGNYQNTTNLLGDLLLEVLSVEDYNQILDKVLSDVGLTRLGLAEIKKKRRA